MNQAPRLHDFLRWLTDFTSAPRPSSSNEQRLRLELEEAQRLFHVNPIRFDDGAGWAQWGVRLSHNGYQVTVRYHRDHPYEPPNIYLYPAPKNRHYYIHDGDRTARLCWCKPGDWRPSFRLIVAIASAMRFLNDLSVGKAT